MQGSDWRRVVEVLLSPGKTFQSIAERPSWLPPLLCLLLLGAAVNFIIVPRMDYDEVIRSAIAQRGLSIGEDQIETQVAMMQRFGWVFGLLGVVILQPLGFVAIALAFWLVFKVFGSEINLKTSFSVTLHSMMPLLIATAGTAAVAIGRDSLTLEEIQGGLLMSNLSFLASEDASSWVRAALRYVDFFSLWTCALLVFGYRAATRLSAGTATGVVVAGWLIWYAGRVGWAGLFG